MLRFYSFIGWLIIKLLSLTIKVRVINDSSWKSFKNVIFAFWHGEQFILYHQHRKQKVAIMTSLSRDGELQSGILSNFGYSVVRGSSSRGGATALIEMLKVLKKGSSVAFAVDGPRGPVYEVKPGVIYLSQKTQIPIIPIAVKYSKAIKLSRTWDQYNLPLPFSTATVIYGKPFYVLQDLPEEMIKAKCEELKDIIFSLKAEKAYE